MTSELVETPASAAAPEAASARDDRMPPGIPFIVANEFAERFCYYGINSILAVYLVEHLHFGEAHATRFSSLFQGGAYFFPLVGALVSDVFWGKFRTIMSFSLVYATGCAVVALVPSVWGLSVGLFLVALGTGGIKPCVSTNVGDQFTSKNQHLIERAFNYFYMAINAGSTISIWFCPVLLQKWGPMPAFGMPGAMMFLATFVFWLGRKRFAVVPPAGKAWLHDAGFMWLWQKTLRPVFVAVGVLKPSEARASAEGIRIIGKLAIVYLFVAVFWSLWNQSNGQTWTLQARSSLMDKNVAFGFTIQPAQIQDVNGPFILAMVPVFTFGIYPLWGRLTKVTPLRKIAAGFFIAASSFLVVSSIEARIQAGQTVSVYWQVLAYGILSAAEVLVSITALEFSYKQAPLRMKSFVMALFLLSSAVGSFLTAGVNDLMVQPLHASAVDVGAETWVTLDEVGGFVKGQKIDFEKSNGVVVTQGGKDQPLEGTFLVAQIDEAGKRVQLMDVVERKPVASTGRYDGSKSEVSTYKLVGPQYFDFFAIMMSIVGLVFIVVAYFYKEKTHVRQDDGHPA